MKEIWKDIKGYEGLYQVSNLGNVKSISRYVIRSGKRFKVNERILSPKIQKNCYQSVYLCNNGLKTKKYIHRLVAIAFLENPNLYECVNHKDENPLNNDVRNLEWCNHKYNMNYGTQIERRKKKVSKKVNQYDKNMNFIKCWESIREAERNGYNSTMISLCCKGKKRTHGGFKWRYANCNEVYNYEDIQKKKVYQYDLELNLIKIWESGADCIREGVATKSIYACCEGKQKTHKGFIWSYKVVSK